MGPGVDRTGAHPRVPRVPATSSATSGSPAMGMDGELGKGDEIPSPPPGLEPAPIEEEEVSPDLLPPEGEGEGGSSGSADGMQLKSVPLGQPGASRTSVPRPKAKGGASSASATGPKVSDTGTGEDNTDWTKFD